MATPVSLTNLIMFTNLKYGFYFLGIGVLLYACEEDTTSIISECPSIIKAEWEEQFQRDALYINSISVQDQELSLNISYGGGCEEHLFQLVQEPLFCGTPPIVLSIYLSHISNDDPCFAYITEDLCFDISSVYNDFPNEDISIYLNNYPHQSDTVWTIE